MLRRLLSTDLVEKFVLDYLGHEPVNRLNGCLRAEIKLKQNKLTKQLSRK